MSKALRAPLLLLAGLGLAGCGERAGNDPQPDLKFGQTVRGKVNYNGQPVPYGTVLFYTLEAVGKGGGQSVAPTATSSIAEDGTYAILDAAVGPVQIVVATDPDLDLHTLIAPSVPGGGMMMGGPPMLGGPPMMGGPPMLGGPPMMGGPPMLGGPPMTGGPPMLGGPVNLGGEPPKDGKVPRPPQPGTQKLTADQKKTLKAIHEKYGKFGFSNLSYVVREGEQTHNIELK